MSEMKRAARSLVEARTERYTSRHGLEESRARLEKALERARITRPWPFEHAWTDEGGAVGLAITFAPSPRTRHFLNASSVVFVLLAWASGYVLLKTSDGAMRFLLPLVTVLAILALPFVTLGLASSREARESRVRRAVKAALIDEDDAFPPQQRWPDET